MKKKLIGFLLCLVAVLGISTTVAFAETIGDSDSGYTYDTVSKVLTITSDTGLTSWKDNTSIAKTDVESIVIGENVTTEINGSSQGFNDCTNVEKVTFDGTVKDNDSISVRNAFSNLSKLKTITFKRNCTVTYCSFQGCSSLETVTFEGTSNLAYYAFMNCPKIKTISFGGATAIGLDVFCSNNSENAQLTELVFPEGSTIASTTSFSKYSALETVTFKGDITLSGGSTFEGCSSLKSVTFEGACTLSSGSEFSNCSSLTSVEFKKESNLSGNAFYNCPNISSITFGEKTTLSGGAFCLQSGANTALKTLTFPVGSTIQNSAFSNYTALESVTFEGNISLEGNSFSGCTSLKSVTFKGTSTLSGGAFYGCTKLESVEFKGISTLSGGAFQNCGLSLENISFGGATKINSAAAFSCDGSDEIKNTTLTKLVFPDGSKLAASVFSKYAKLKTVTFEGSIDLADAVFSKCSELKDFYFNGADTSVITLSNFVFSGFENKADDSINIYVPSDTAVTNYTAKFNDASSATGNNNSLYAKYIKTNAEHAATHNWSEGVCSICNTTCKHAGETKQWAYNETQHWEVYSTCGAKTSLGVHEFGMANKCTTCGYAKPVATYSGGSGSTVQKPTVTTPENGKVALSNNGRTATITPEEGYQVASVTVNGVDKGKVTELTGLKTGDEVVVTFEKTKETLDKEASEAVGALSSMKARSSRTAKGNVKVVMNLSRTEKAKLAELKAQGYTVKYKFYRSTKKSSGYTAMKTKDTTTYINTKGVKKTMYYYKARVLVYDQDGKLVASTKLSDCKYANRTWTKK